VAGILLAYPDLRPEVEGHTDSVGSEDYNQRLSEHRAATVRDYLVQQGVSINNVVARASARASPSPPTPLQMAASRTAASSW